MDVRIIYFVVLGLSVTVKTMPTANFPTEIRSLTKTPCLQQCLPELSATHNQLHGIVIDRHVSNQLLFYLLSVHVTHRDETTKVPAVPTDCSTLV